MPQRAEAMAYLIEGPLKVLKRGAASLFFLAGATGNSGHPEDNQSELCICQHPLLPLHFPLETNLPEKEVLNTPIIPCRPYNIFLLSSLSRYCFFSFS